MKKIHLLGMDQKWSIGEDFKLYNEYFKKFGYDISTSPFAFSSIVYLSGRYNLQKSFYHIFKNLVVFDYFHGLPTTNSEFERIFNSIITNKKKFHKIRITNSKIKKAFDKNGLEDKTKIIPIGIKINDFKILDKIEKVKLKKELGLPDNKFIIGSFQKDGVGWDGGDNPKLIKGPDILIQTIEKIYQIKKDIIILLLGPSRNYVKKNLSKLNIPFKHIYEKDYKKITNYYNLLDLYLITSREEGGPKSLLESMACEVPVISTPVGQCIDIIKNEKNGFLCDGFSSDEIASKSLKILNKQIESKKIIEEGYKTALLHNIENQKELWEEFFSFNT